MYYSSKTERDKRIAYRINAVLLSDEGWGPAQIARALFLDEETIRRYLSAYEEENRLSPQHKGSKPLLTEKESEALSAHLESQIYVKIKDIQAYVKKLLKKICLFQRFLRGYRSIISHIKSQN